MHGPCHLSRCISHPACLLLELYPTTFRVPLGPDRLCLVWMSFFTLPRQKDRLGWEQRWCWHGELCGCRELAVAVYLCVTPYSSARLCLRSVSDGKPTRKLKAVVAKMSAHELLSNKMKYLITEPFTEGLNSRSLSFFFWL